jgi:hypothetical protein
VLALIGALVSGATAPVAASSARLAASVAPGLLVSAQDSSDGARVEFRGGEGAVVSRDERSLRLRFSRPGRPDLSPLVVRPPALLESVRTMRQPDGLELTLNLAPEAEAQVRRTADGLSVELSKRVTRPRAAGAARLTASETTTGTSLAVAFNTATGAAVFRRGEAIWLVFDADTPLSPAAAGRGIRSVTSHRGPGWTALRISVTPRVQASVVAKGASWTVRLDDQPTAPARLEMMRDQAGSAELAAGLPGATAVRRIVDPVVGDALTVVTALGPAKGVPTGRSFVEMAVLPSAHGLAVEPLADDLRVAIEGEQVRFVRPDGLQLSAGAGGAPLSAAQPDAPRRAALPGAVDLAGWSQTGPGGFLKRYDALLAAAAAEAAAPQPGGAAPHEARMALARFLVGSQLPHEAVGVLDALGRTQPSVMGDAEFRGCAALRRR